jgi:hypothetical protein
LCGLPGKGVLAPAIADDQDLHTCHLSTARSAVCDVLGWDRLRQI